jgi:hypothetical protein
MRRTLLINYAFLLKVGSFKYEVSHDQDRKTTKQYNDIKTTYGITQYHCKDDLFSFSQEFKEVKL